MNILFRRRRAEVQRQAVIAGLDALKIEFADPHDRGYINDMILYAKIGRDRYSLDESWVNIARNHLERCRLRNGVATPDS